MKWDQLVLPFAPNHLPAAFRDARVLAAMEKVPRERFVPPHLREEATLDVALPIGHGQTISQPFVVAFMTAGLNVRPGGKILEIGTGSGYQVAILAELGVEVYTIEVLPDLAQRAKLVLEELGLANNVHFRVGDGWHGWSTAAPFDGIICTAAPERVPPALIEQLAPGGRLVIPVGVQETQLLLVLERTSEGMKELASLPVRFVPLVRTPAHN